MSDPHSLARAQLAELLAEKPTVIRLREIEPGRLHRSRWERERDQLHLDVELSTHGLRAEQGAEEVAAWEPFTFIIDAHYPHRPPGVRVAAGEGAGEKRWAHLPYVQWAVLLRLFGDESEQWNAAEGLYGLVDRVREWMRAMLAGELPPDGLLLRPPRPQLSPRSRHLRVEPELTLPHERETDLLYAWCTDHDGEQKISRWLRESQLQEQLASAHRTGEKFHLAPALLLGTTLQIRYPSSLGELYREINELPLLAGLRLADPAGALEEALRRAAAANQTSPADSFSRQILLLGTRLGSTDSAHLTAWSMPGTIDEDSGLEWLEIDDGRHGVVRRRRQGPVTAWLDGKKVLLLGCGSLGAPIAEHCVRAGVKTLTLVDHGTVTPPDLLNQPYAPADINEPKVERLAQRLRALRSDLEVRPHNEDILAFFDRDSGAPADHDLVVDATSQVSVRSAIEVAHRRDRDAWPPLLTLLLGPTAERAMVLLCREGATAAGYDVLRRTAIDTRVSGRAEAWEDILQDFLTSAGRRGILHPGSAVQTHALASALFWAGLAELENSTREEPMVAIPVRLPGRDLPLKSMWLTWCNDHLVADVPQEGSPVSYEVRLSQRALATMRTESRRNHRERAPGVPSGGVLFGAFDDTLRILHIDAAGRPATDVTLYGHDRAGTQALNAHHRRGTQNRVRLVGSWSLHPDGHRDKPLPQDQLLQELARLNGDASDPAHRFDHRFDHRFVLLSLTPTEGEEDEWRKSGRIPPLQMSILFHDVTALHHSRRVPPPCGNPRCIQQRPGEHHG